MAATVVASASGYLHEAKYDASDERVEDGMARYNSEILASEMSGPISLWYAIVRCPCRNFDRGFVDLMGIIPGGLVRADTSRF
jgi:hypothetical protein